MKIYSDSVLFDGDCGFCNKFLMLIAEKDFNDNFIFISNKSKVGLELINKYSIPELGRKTIILIEKKQIFTRSEAIKRIFKKIPSFKLLGYLMELINTTLMDLVYNEISKRRRKLINNCKTPKNHIKKKFIH